MQRDPSQLRFATTHLTTSPRLHYAEQDDPTGEAIIFLHGYSDSWFSFIRVLPLLSPEYHAFALTERGHGDSDKPERCYTLDDFAADVDVFMDTNSPQTLRPIEGIEMAVRRPLEQLD
jgi:non-heme chloroperoxidase